MMSKSSPSDIAHIVDFFANSDKFLIDNGTSILKDGGIDDIDELILLNTPVNSIFEGYKMYREEWM